MRKYLCLIILFAFAKPVFVQKNSTSKLLDTSLVKFFTGKWVGQGKFANGKEISADVSIVLSLDSTWLEYTHIDRSPNRYKATYFWGVDGDSGE